MKITYDDNLLHKIQQHVTKTYISPYIKEYLLENGFDTVAREALDRMHVKWEPGSVEQEYNQEKTQ